MVRRVTLDDAAVHRVVEAIPYVAQDPPTQGALSTCVVECRVSMIRITIIVECRVSFTTYYSGFGEYPTKNTYLGPILGERMRRGEPGCLSTCQAVVAR